MFDPDTERLIAELPSTLRTPEQMKWIADRYKIGGLERLARSSRDYYSTHGEYLPDVAALAHAAVAALTESEAAREKAYDEGWDAGRADWLEEPVCSACGENHDRDESAGCEGAIVVMRADYPEVVAHAETMRRDAEARLRSATRALQEIAGHDVRDGDVSPCDWHCTRGLTDIAKRELESLGDATASGGQQAGADR